MITSGGIKSIVKKERERERVRVKERRPSPHDFARGRSICGPT
jgi:hypothetical protein